MSTDQPKPEEKQLSAPKPTAIVAGNRGLVLSSLDEMWRAAGAFHKSSMFSQTHDSQEKIFVAMQCGAEVGLAPIQSLTSIAVINGRPAMWGDAIPGLIWASGLMESLVETIEGEGDAMVARCVAKRRGVADAIERAYSVDDAKTAKLWGKMGKYGPTPWVTNPKRMLQMRARAFCLRDGFADVLKGLQVSEEVMDYTDINVSTGQTTPKLTARLSQELPEDEPETEGQE